MDTPDGTANVSDRTFARVSMALWSIAAGAIHFAVVPEHLAEYRPFGYFFIVAATFQVLWPMAIVSGAVANDRRMIVAGGVLNYLIAMLWLLARTTGLPLGPEAGVAESFGFADTVSAVFEIGVAALSACYLANIRWPVRRVLWSLAAVGIVTFGVTSAALVSLGNGETEMNMEMEMSPS